VEKHIFISHAWKYSDDYYRLENLLKKEKDNPLSKFSFKNYSVPEHDPLIDPNTEIGKRKLTAMLDTQIKPVSCVIILGGMYANYSYWIQKEIDIAKSYPNKGIIAVYPWGQTNMPVKVQESAHFIVGWQTSSIVNAIMKC
jgi:hypothetical protein